MGLLSAIWQRQVWCGLIGGCLGLAVGVAGLFQKTSGQGQNSIALEFFFDAIVGTLFGMILLGIPASIWVLGKWMIHGGKSTAVVASPPPVPGSVSHNVVHDAGHAAMVGSTAAVPGAIAGGLGGAALGGLCLGAIMFLSMITGSPWYNDIVNNYLVVWFLSFTVGGAVVGLLGGMFLGSALGAIFGGVRSMSRH